MNALFSSFSLLSLLQHWLSPFTKFMISFIIVIVVYIQPTELSAI